MVDKQAPFSNTPRMPGPIDSGPEDPAAAMAAVIALRRLADGMERAAVDAAIRDGWTWAQVAQALGITRQAAHKRHADRIRTARTEDHE
jgi:hypothetical protein